MAKRDRDLLEAAGLGINEAADLFGRKKQAIYQGISQEREYFGLEDWALLIQDCKRRDSAHLDQLLKFVAFHRPQGIADLLLPKETSGSQMEHVLRESDRAILVFNGNLEHLQPDTPFSAALALLLKQGTPFALLVPSEWAKSYFQSEEVGIDQSNIYVNNEVRFHPCFFLADGKHGTRGFVFGRRSAEELLVTEARQLWKMLEPSNSADGASTRRAAG